jgi:hypothetical protein
MRRGGVELWELRPFYLPYLKTKTERFERVSPQGE